MTVLSEMWSPNLLKADRVYTKITPAFLFPSTLAQTQSMPWSTHHWSIWPPGHGPGTRVWKDPPPSVWCRFQLGCRLRKQATNLSAPQSYQTSLLSKNHVLELLPLCYHLEQVLRTKPLRTQGAQLLGDTGFTLYQVIHTELKMKCYLLINKRV